jgi:hypothetical protein
LCKDFTTAVSISDSLIFLSLQKQNLVGDFQSFQKWEEENLPPIASKTKGGLNKSYIETPTLLSSTEQWDIFVAYATFTGTESGPSQWYTIYEILTLGTIHPTLKVAVHSAFYWLKERTTSRLCIEKLYDS